MYYGDMEIARFDASQYAFFGKEVELGGLEEDDSGQLGRLDDDGFWETL